MFFFNPRHRGLRGRAPAYNNNNNLDVYTLFMAAQLYQQIDRLPVKPPVTLAIMAALAGIFLFPVEAGAVLGGDYVWVQSGAFNPYLILEYGQSHRVLASTLIHASTTHLYHNLSSFLYKGVVLESALGSERFFFTVAVLLGLSQVVFLALSYALTVSGVYPDAWTTNTVGFSGVIFALKVLLNRFHDVPGGFGLGNLLGLNLPWDRVVWIELITAQLVNPGSSFLGHLSGMIAGLLFMPAFSWMLGVGHAAGGGGEWVNRDETPPETYTRPPSPPVHPTHARQPPPPPTNAEEQQPISLEELRRRRMNRLG